MCLKVVDNCWNVCSPDGTMLVSQGKDPDYTITVWDWGRAQIILRVKSHGQDVFNAEFSQFVPGQLTTSGKHIFAHI